MVLGDLGMAKKKSNADNEAKKIGDELYCFKIDEAFESDQDTIAFFWLCIYENYMDKAAKYDKVDVSKLNTELLSAFSTWDIEENWEENNFGTGRLADRNAPGGEKVLRLYNGYMGWMLIVEFENMDEEEKKTVVSLLEKYYNHITSDFDKKKALKKRNEAALEPDPEPKYDIMDVLINGNICREYLEDCWDVSSYDEGEDCQIDYYLKKDDNVAGDTAYMYSHEDDELRKLEIVHIIARSADPDAYDKLLEDDDVLINGEGEYGADCSAEFILLCDSFLVWFKEAD